MLVALTVAVMQSGEIALLLTVGTDRPEVKGVVRELFKVKTVTDNLSDAIAFVRAGAEYQLQHLQIS